MSLEKNAEKRDRQHIAGTTESRISESAAFSERRAPRGALSVAKFQPTVASAQGNNSSPAREDMRGEPFFGKKNQPNYAGKRLAGTR